MGSRLKDKVAIITGAGSIGPGWGNGRATVVRFVEEGAKVFAVDRDAASLKETLEKAPGIATHICDVTDGKAVAAMIRACLDKFGRVDVLVNNVGGSAPGGPVEMTEEVWDAQVDLNLKSVFLACKHALPVMEQPRLGCDRQHRLGLRHPLERLGAGRLRRDQGRRDPADARGGGAVRAEGHPSEQCSAGTAAHADGGSAPGEAARRRRRRSAAARAG